MNKTKSLSKKILLDMATMSLILFALFITIIFWFPMYFSFGFKVYGINIPHKTPINITVLLITVLGIIGSTYKIIRNSLRHFFIILSVAIILGHVIMVMTF